MPQLSLIIFSMTSRITFFAVFLQHRILVVRLLYVNGIQFFLMSMFSFERILVVSNI